MTNEQVWEQVMLDLIQEQELENTKAQQRLESARRAADASQQKLETLRAALEHGRAKRGLPEPLSNVPDPSQVAEFLNKSAKDMLHYWADTHGGEVVMRDATKFLAAAGLFRDETQAAGTLYPAVNRSPDFIKIARGVYRRTGPLPNAISSDDHTLATAADSDSADLDLEKFFSTLRDEPSDSLSESEHSQSTALSRTPQRLEELEDLPF
jgi:hypothetical protein